MFKNFIFHPKSWSIIHIATYIVVGSCEGNCEKKDTKGIKVNSPTSPTAPIVPSTDDTNPDHWKGSTDSLDSETSDASEGNSSSGIFSGSADSESSSSSATVSGSADSGSSSGYGSSGSGSYTPPPPTRAPFAGLPNIGNTCYMNAVLQIIAALYTDKVKNTSLEGLINTINTKDQPLSCDKLKEFIKLFPEEAKKMAESGKQEDPDEFIMALEGSKFLAPIRYTENLFFKRLNIANQGIICQKKCSNQITHGLKIGFNQSSSSSFNLTEMIASNREEVMNNQAIAIDSLDSCVPYKGTQSSFLKNNKESLAPQSGDSLSNCIKQEVIDTTLYKLYILYVQLNRYVKSSSISKITEPVNGTMEITIQPDPNLPETIKFNLNGFIVHHGSDPNSGHYIAYVKRQEKWYQANDANITEINQSEAEEASKDAYLLFYIKQ